MLKVYLFMIVGWLALTIVGVSLRRGVLGRYILKASYVVLILFCIEFACVMAFFMKNRTWPFNDQRVFLRELFEPHPYLVGVPRKNARVSYRGISYTHNAQGFRGRDFPARSVKIRVIAMGGSTTYGANVSDDQTWPVYLETLLGSDYEVLNLGVLGYSTVEHITQAALIMPEYHPDILIIHTGLNDLRNLRIKGLLPDYSDYHASSRYSTLGLCPEDGLPRLASLKVAVRILQKVGLYPGCAFPRPAPQQDLSPASEEFAKHLYRRNLETLIAIAKRQGLRPILVPQVLVRERLEGGRLKWWIPFVGDDELIAKMNEYNRIMEEVANQEGLQYVQAVASYSWAKEDFADPSHLNAEGNRKFAQLVLGAVKDQSKEKRS